MKKSFSFLSLILLLVVVPKCLHAQAMSDTTFNPRIADPKYMPASGPLILVDSAHHNYHTASGRYEGFSKLAMADGFRVRDAGPDPLTSYRDSLVIYVISNALHPSNIGNWRLPNPSAFTEQEIQTIKAWVENGGRLFLIADHMPFAGAAADLAAAFGITWYNCFAMDITYRNPEFFTLANKKLLPCPLLQTTNGMYIDSIITFTGSAFTLSEGTTPVLQLKNYSILMPEIAWRFDDNTRIESGEPFYQLAYKIFGKGKIVFSGEAAMFSAQIVNGQKTGMNRNDAAGNRKLLSALLRWLAE